MKIRSMRICQYYLTPCKGTEDCDYYDEVNPLFHGSYCFYSCRMLASDYKAGKRPRRVIPLQKQQRREKKRKKAGKWF